MQETHHATRLCSKRTFAATAVISTLLTQVSFAQLDTPASTPLTADERAEIVRKEREEKANDEAYKSTLKRLPDAARQKTDPWGGVRTPSANSGGK
jgi:hypothetical protein